MAAETTADTTWDMEAAQVPDPLPGLQRTGRELGTLLVEAGAITHEQLQEALADTSGRRVGEVVVDLGYATARAVAQALAAQTGLSFIDIGRTKIDMAAAALLPEKLARRYTAMPLSFLDGSTLLVGVADPTDIVAVDDLRIALGMEVQVVVADAAELEEAIAQTYRAHVEIVDAAADGPPEPPLSDVRASAQGEAPAIRLVNQVLATAIEEGASDVHFEPQENELVVRARIDGVTRRLTAVPRSIQTAVTARLKIMAELDIAEKRMPQDGRLSILFGDRPMDLRVAVLPTRHGEQVVLRVQQRTTRRVTVDDLGMTPLAAERLVHALTQPYGAVITVGPTGSGKTTTLYAALDMLNDEGRVLMTIEDPVEWHLPGINQVEVNARAGLTFASGLRTLLRSDPDVVLVGEIRDEETARTAMQAAMTGHLLLTSLHTQNAASSIARLKDMGVEPSLLANAINCIVAQRLARRLCVECRVAYAPDDAERELLAAPPGTVVYAAGGCAHCGGTGYRGRVALYEVMPIQGRVRPLVAASTEEIFATAVSEGMTTLRQDGVRLVLDGLSSVDEIRRVTGDRLV